MLAERSSDSSSPKPGSLGAESCSLCGGVKVRALDASRLPPVAELLQVELLGEIIKVHNEVLAAGLDGFAVVAAPRNVKASCEDLRMDAVEGPAPDNAPPGQVEIAELAPVGGVNSARGSHSWMAARWSTDG